MSRLARLARALAEQDPASLAAPVGGRVGATLVLFAERDGAVEVVYTRRRDDLRAHPGQISFPGGRVEPGETVERAAVREAVEEVALDPTTVEVLGLLPAFYIPPSRFWLQPVVARWAAPHGLVAAEAEVAEVLQVPLRVLTDPAVWRVVRLSTHGWSWAWQLDDRHLLWGATAMVTARLLDLLDPDWSGGRVPQELAEREVIPWRGPPRFGAGPARVEGSTSRLLDADVLSELPASPDGSPTPATARAAGVVVADAVSRMPEAGGGRVVVLAGAGGNGVVGRAAADQLADLGVDVQVISADDFDAAAPALVVDALVGGGLDGPLRGVPLAIAHALRAHLGPVVAIDIASGLHPTTGLVGEIMPADVTVALGRPRPAVLLGGLHPYVGDLYVPLGGGLARLVAAAEKPAPARRR